MPNGNNDQKNKSAKIVLDLKDLNHAIHKNKHQMQSIHHLTDAVANYISERSNEHRTFCFSKIDLNNA